MLMNQILKIIKEENGFAIIPHINPDGDTLGSSIALALTLKKLNKDVDIIIDDDIPKNYSFLIKKFPVKKYHEAANSYKVIFTIDCTDLERIGRCKNLIRDKVKSINIDHHTSNTFFCQLNLVDKKAAATGEIVYQLVKLLGVDWDSDIATALYTSIITDTGCFKYANTTSITHQIAGDLINSDANIQLVVEELYEKRSVPKTLLLGRALNNITILLDQKIAYIVITRRMLEECGATDGDTEGIVNYAKEIEDVEVGILFKEEENRVKVSVRSRRYVNCNELCKHFNGGGHIRAAGCVIESNLDKAISMFIDKTREELKKIFK